MSKSLRTARAAFAVMTVGFVCVPIQAAEPYQFQLDLSSALNYDAVGTSLELSTNVPTNGNFLSSSLGQHSIGNSRAYVNQGSVPANQTALPDDGVVSAGGWTYQFSTAFDNGLGTAATSNTMAVINPGRTTVNGTFTLAAEQQQGYDNINFAFVASRGGSSTYRSFITANYTDGSSDIIYDTGDVIATAAGGTFGSAGVGGVGGYGSVTDTNDDVTLVLGSTYQLGQSGSLQSIRGGTASVWQFASGLELDKERALQSVTFSLVSAGASRSTSFWLFGATANTPEPSSIALLALPALAILRRRRREAVTT